MTNLAITDNDVLIQYTSLGESTFVFDFPILNVNELRVSIDRVDQIYGTDFTIAGVGDAGGGSITFMTATTAGEIISIWQELPVARLTGFSEGAATLLGSDLNNEFVKVYRQNQELRRDFRRALRVPIDDSVTGVNMELGLASDRAGKFLRFSDPAGAPELSEIITTGTVLSQSVIAGYLYPITPAEIAAGVTIVNYRYEPGHVLRYGTNTTPGTTDMTAAIQAAYSSVGVGQSVVYPPGHVLRITAPITMTGKDDITIVGNGATMLEASGVLTEHLLFTSCNRLSIDNLSFLAGEDTTYFGANTPSEERQFIDLVTCEDVTVRNVTGRLKRRLLTALTCPRLLVDGFSFVGFMPTIGTPNANGLNAPCVTVRDSDHVVVTNGRVYNHGAAVLSQLSSEHITVSNIVGKELHDNGVYISSCVHGNVSGCSLENTTGDGVQVRGDYMTVTGNSVKGCGAYGISATPVATGSSTGSCAITGNVVVDCNLGIGATQLTNEPSDVTITGNVVLDTQLAGDTGAIVVNSQAGRVVVSGNVVHGSATDVGIAIGDVGTVTSHLVVSNNIVSDINGSAASTRGGIRMDDCANVVVNGNVFSDIASGIGVRCRAVDGGVISGNVYEGGQVVRIPTAESNVDLVIIGNRGATAVVDTENNRMFDNDIATPIWPAEIVAATNVITAKESGRIFYLNAAGGLTSTLPAPAAGLKYTFIVKTAPTTAYIITTNAGANILYGTFLDIVGELTYFSAQDTLNFVAGTSVVGDRLEVESDGTNWYCKAFSGANGGITVAVT